MNRSTILLLAVLWFGIISSTPQSTPTAQPSPLTPAAQAGSPQVQGQQTTPSITEPASDRTEPPTTRVNPAPRVQAPVKNETDKVASDQTAAQQLREPKTEILDSSATSGAVTADGHDPLLDPPPFPTGTTTLVGGIISGVDRIRNHLTVSIFGTGDQWTVYFDERTHIFRHGAEVTPLALKRGERVYVDTMLDNNRHDIFARNIRLGLVTPPAEAAGQILQVDARHSELVVRDSINSASVRFGVDKNTRISHGSKPGTFRDLVAGSLVRVQFFPDRANGGLAREIVVLAVPGSVFTFTGTVTFLDTHRNLLSVHNSGDDKTYDIYFTPAHNNPAEHLAVGAEVQIRAVFEATHYVAQQVTVIGLAGTTVP